VKILPIVELHISILVFYTKIFGLEAKDFLPLNQY